MRYVTVSLYFTNEEINTLKQNASKFMKTRGFSSKNKRIVRKKLKQLLEIAVQEIL